jgi:hypothetical protein
MEPKPRREGAAQVSLVYVASGSSGVVAFVSVRLDSESAGVQAISW